MSEPTLIRPQKTTDLFRSMKMGDTIRITSTCQESSHATARLVGIKVKTKIVDKPATGGVVVDVTRVPNRKAKA